MSEYVFTSESVTEGHPDKICDQISDAILDALLSQDPDSRVACETVVNTGLCLLTGEITSKAKVDYIKIARKVINDIIEMIDIGGPSLLRASGKNFRYIAPIMDIKDYKKLIGNLKKNNGVTDLSFRKKMAHKIYKGTSNYDKIISDWLDENQK